MPAVAVAEMLHGAVPPQTMPVATAVPVGLQPWQGLQFLGGATMPPAAGLPPTQPLQPINPNQLPAGPKKAAATKGPAKPRGGGSPQLSAYEKKRQATIDDNKKQLVSLGLAKPAFVNSSLMDTMTSLTYDKSLFNVKQRVAIYYNEEHGWLAGKISAVQKKKTWTTFDGEEEEYQFPMKPNEYGKTWVFAQERDE